DPDSSLFADNFMGGTGDPNDGYIVKTGPFRQEEWPVIFDGPYLVRNFGEWGAIDLPTPDDVAGALAVPKYDAAPWNGYSDVQLSFRNNVEGWNHPTRRAEIHNKVHEWIGGQMLGLSSPNEPLFWLLHANIDRLWAQWQDEHPDEGYRPEEGG